MHRLLACCFVLSACAGSISGNSDGGNGGDAAVVVCAGSLMKCGGTCVDTTSDPANCGSCGHACGTSAQCCSGACVTTASCAFSVTSVSPQNGWQNGGGWVTLGGSGFGPSLRVMLGDGRAPTRVLDASHALIQTPPGPLGAVDVKIVDGAQTATLAGGFIYQSGGLDMQWQQKPLASVRGEDPAVAVMQDGRVLVAGGTTVPDHSELSLDTAEIYTRMTDMVTPAAGTMATPRWQDAAVTLLTGKVLVVGGACGSDLSGCTGDPTLADLFDPATDTFTPTASPLNRGRAYTRAVLLPDGRALVMSANDPSLEIYDPDLDKFTLVPATQPHVFGVMARLRDVRVLLAGGDGGVKAAELFDPDTDTIASVGAMNQARSMFTAHTLPDGRVFVIGGSDQSAGGIHTPLATIESFDATTMMFTPLGYALTTPRTWHASALVRDGTILVMGGYTVDGQCASLTSGVEQVDPVAGMVTAFPSLLNANTEWNATTLLDGSVLGVGGGACGTAMALPDIDFLAGSIG